jgi:F-type H+-transporting ATPase subunit b
VWLLKRFLYKPILDALDAREKLIAKELAEAEAKKVAAHQERDEFQRKNAEFDQQRATRLTQVTDEAKAERQRLLEEARQAADALTVQRAETLRSEARNLAQTITDWTQQEVFAIVRKTLNDLATASLEERMVAVFIRHLRTMDGPGKAGWVKALQTSTAPALVRSTFDLPTAQRDSLQQALNETFSAAIPLQFETAPSLISGIEFTSNGQKVTWSIADYLGSLATGVNRLLPASQAHEPAT